MRDGFLTIFLNVDAYSNSTQYAQTHSYSDQPKKAKPQDLRSFLVKHSSTRVPSHLRCLLKTHAKQCSSSDTLSKLNNSPCFHLPIPPSANLKAFHILRLLRQGSNKRCCQLTRWKNILLIFFLSPSLARSLDVRRRGPDHSLPGGSLTQGRLPLT